MSTQPERVAAASVDLRRELLGIDEAIVALTGATVDAVEFVQGETEDEDCLVLRLGTVTLYADAPRVYGDSPIAMVPNRERCACGRELHEDGTCSNGGAWCG